MSEVLYLSIVDDIKKRILAGEFGPGDMLHSESSMSKEYNVSRMTVRKSLALLANEGYIYSIPGKGNFVCSPEKKLYQFHYDKYENYTLPVDEVRLLSVDVGAGEERIRRRLNIEGRRFLIRVVRVLFSGETRLAAEYTHFLYVPHMPVVEERLKFANHLESLERSAGFSLEKKLHLSASMADASLAGYLNCPEGTPLFYIEEEVTNSEDKTAYYFTETYALPEYVSITAATQRDEGSMKL